MPNNSGSSKGWIVWWIVQGLLLVYLAKAIHTLITPAGVGLNHNNGGGRTAMPAWKPSEMANLYVYLSSEPIQTVFLDENLVWTISQIRMQNANVDGLAWKQQPKVKTVNVIPNRRRQLFAHIYLVREGYTLDPLKGPYSPTAIVYRRQSLIDTSEWLYYPHLDISLVFEDRPIHLAAMPFHIRKHIPTDPQGTLHFPVLYLNDFWHLKERRIPITDGDNGDKSDDKSVQQLSLHMSFDRMGQWKFQLLNNLDRSFQINQQLFGGGEAAAAVGAIGDFDSIKVDKQ